MEPPMEPPQLRVLDINVFASSSIQLELKHRRIVRIIRSRYIGDDDFGGLSHQFFHPQFDPPLEFIIPIPITPILGGGYYTLIRLYRDQNENVDAEGNFGVNVGGIGGGGAGGAGGRGRGRGRGGAGRGRGGGGGGADVLGGGDGVADVPGGGGVQLGDVVSLFVRDLDLYILGIQQGVADWRFNIDRGEIADGIELLRKIRQGQNVEGRPGDFPFGDHIVYGFGKNYPDRMSGIGTSGIGTCMIPSTSQSLEFIYYSLKRRTNTTEFKNGMMRIIITLSESARFSEVEVFVKGRFSDGINDSVDDHKDCLVLGELIMSRMKNWKLLSRRLQVALSMGLGREEMAEYLQPAGIVLEDVMRGRSLRIVRYVNINLV